MADKIDQIAGYDIDLPPDATPSIASLTVSGNITEAGSTLGGKYAAKSHTHSYSDVGAASAAHTHSGYVNQNAFSYIKVGSTDVAADVATDTVTFVGSNVTITPDATNDKITFGITKANVTTALAYTPLSSHQNAYSAVVVGDTAVAAAAAGDDITFTGNNVTLTPNTASQSIEFKITKANVTTALGYTPGTSNLTLGTGASNAAAGNHTHSAYVNQNAFSRITVGSTNVDADTATDAVTFVGSNITITPDATNDKVTFSLTTANVTTALGYTPGTSNLTLGTGASNAAAGNHTHSAYVNQNAFSRITVGSTNIDADTTTDAVTFVGTNITITPDATNDKVTFNVTKANVTTALGYTPPTQDTNTWRTIQLNGSDILGSTTTTNKLNIKAGSNMTITNSSGTLTFAASGGGGGGNPALFGCGAVATTPNDVSNSWTAPQAYVGGLNNNKFNYCSMPLLGNVTINALTAGNTAYIYDWVFKFYALSGGVASFTGLPVFWATDNTMPEGSMCCLRVSYDPTWQSYTASLQCQKVS